MTKILAVPALILALSFFGCDTSDVGVPCEISGEGSGEGESGTQFNLQALDCESRICVSYLSADQNKARCTRTCESDSDCPDEAVGSCQTKFVCRVGQAVGGLACCKVCVCNDDVTSSTDEEAEACSRLPESEKAKCPDI